MHTFRSDRAALLGLAISAAALVVTAVGPGAATAGTVAKEQLYEAKFDCAIPLTATTCSVTLDKKIPAGKRLRIEYVKARLMIPNAVRSGFEFAVDYGDPGAAGSVGSIKVVPQSAGRTEGGFFAIWAVNEKVQAYAYRTANYPAPKVHLTNPTGDALHLQNGSIQDGVLGGHLVAAH
jgi:hypothetical protein